MVILDALVIMLLLSEAFETNYFHLKILMVLLGIICWQKAT